MSDVIVNLDLTSIEKETLKEFMRMRQENAPVLLLGAEELSQLLTERVHDISRPRAYAILSKLEEKGIVQKIKRKGFVLTEEGNKVLDELLHRLKVLETYLHDQVGLPLDADPPFTSASKEASQLVLHVSFELIERLCEIQDNPKTCPHDIEIPHHPKHSDLEDILNKP